MDLKRLEQIYDCGKMFVKATAANLTDFTVTCRLLFKDVVNNISAIPACEKKMIQ